jgi:inner membrane protein involved in colicin E2 resistance
MSPDEIMLWLSIGLTLALVLVIPLVMVIRLFTGRSPREESSNATVTRSAMLQQAMYHLHHGEST